MAKQQIPVYMICGFLESGKTNFIAPMLAGEDFTADERTLLLVTEEGEEEYDEQALMHYDVRMQVFDEQEDFTKEACTKLDNKYHPTQVVIEYNGMWNLPDIQNVLPEHWVLYQIVTTVDSTTFDMYSKNMSSLMMQHISNADMVIFNRCTDATDKAYLHRAVRMVNRRAQMAFERTDGSVDPDDVVDELPFDTDAPVIDIADEDFGLWYLDAMDNLDKYMGKTVRFKGYVCQTPRVPKGCFVPGRFGMTCCAEDISFIGFICAAENAAALQHRSWVTVTATVGAKEHPIYDGVGPWLEALRRIGPEAVTIYTVARETPVAGLSKAAPEVLDAIAERVRALGIHCTVSY